MGAVRPVWEGAVASAQGDTPPSSSSFSFFMSYTCKPTTYMHMLGLVHTHMHEKCDFRKQGAQLNRGTLMSNPEEGSGW